MKILLATVGTVAVMASSSVVAQSVDIMEGWSYDGLYSSGISIDQLLDDATVFGPTGDEIGTVENVIFSDSGEALAIIAEVGGFWDIGDTHVSVPWDEVVIGFDEDIVTVPVTEENAGDYPMYGDNGWFSEQTYFARDADDIQVVNDNLEGGPDVFRASEFIGDYVYLSGYAPYGYVNDLIIEDGQVTAIVMDASTYYGRPGYYALPYDYTTAWDPYDRGYQMPYGTDVVDEIEVFDYDLMTSSID